MKYSSKIENGVHAGVAYSFDGSTYYFRVSIWQWAKINSAKFFVLIQSKGVGRNLFPAKISGYTVLSERLNIASSHPPPLLIRYPINTTFLTC